MLVAGLRVLFAPMGHPAVRRKLGKEKAAAASINGFFCICDCARSLHLCCLALGQWLGHEKTASNRTVFRV